MQELTKNSSYRPRRSANSPAVSKRTSPRVSIDATSNPSKIGKASGKKKEKPSKSTKEEGKDDRAEQVGSVEEQEIGIAREAKGTETVPDDAAEIEAEVEDEEEEDESDEHDEGEEVVELLGEGFYEVEAVKKKRFRKGQVQYFIKWRGWPESANTWEPYDNLKACADIIEDFEQRRARRGRGKRKLGTYLLPLKRKRSSISNADEDSSAVDIGNNGPVSPKKGNEKQGIESPNAIGDRAETHLCGVLQVSAQEMATENVNGSKGNGDSKKVGLDQSVDVFQERSLPGRSQSEETLANVDEIGLKQKLQNSPATILNREALATDGFEGAMKSSSSSTGAEIARVCKEILAGNVAANGISDGKEESLMTEVGLPEQHLHSPADAVVEETKSPLREGGNHSSASHSERTASDEYDKVASIDKCTGAKKRKQGFVRRVRQSLDSQEHEGKHIVKTERRKKNEQVFDQPKLAMAKEGDLVMEDGRIMQKPTDQQGLELPDPRQVQESRVSDMPLSSLLQDLPLSTSTNTSLPITELIKAVSYSNHTVDGKQDVCVLFKATRSDGQEVMVDNKSLRANHPLLLIDFYEQHLRYSASQ